MPKPCSAARVLCKCAHTLELGFGVHLPFAERLAVRYCRSLEARAMDFRFSKAQQRLQQKCRELAEDFATRSAGHDRDASHPTENYQRLRDEGFLALSVARESGGSGASFLDHTIAYEAGTTLTSIGAYCLSVSTANSTLSSVGAWTQMSVSPLRIY